MNRFVILTVGLCLCLGVCPATPQEPTKPFNLDFLQGQTFGGDAVTGDVQLTGRFEIAKDQREGRLSIAVVTRPSWHVYSLTQPSGGPLPSRLEVKTSDRLERVGDFTPDRPPHVRDVEVFPVPIEEHTGQVTWTAPIRLAERANVEQLQITVVYDGQVCNDEGGCIPIHNREVLAEFTGYYEPLAAIDESVFDIDALKVETESNSQRSLGATLVFALIGGFVLNFVTVHGLRP